MKRIRTNRRKELERKNFRTFIAGITAVAVVMGSSYFVVPTFATGDEVYCGEQYPAAEYHIGDAEDPAEHTKDCYVLTEKVCDGKDCYGLECEKELHGHSAGCFEKNLICGVEAEDALAHVHEDACWTTSTVAECTHECGDDCAAEGCTHECGDECSKEVTNLTCEFKDKPAEHGTEHTDACYETVKTCKYAYDHPKHTYEDGCYEKKDDIAVAEEPVEESEENAGEGVVVVSEGNDTEESAAVHEDGTCYALDTEGCGKGLHTHTAICYVPEEERQAIEDVMTAIKDLTTESNAVGVEEVRFDYNALNDRQKAVVDEAKLDEKLEAVEIHLEIAALPAATDALSEDLVSAKKMLDALKTNSYASLVTTTKLTETSDDNEVNTYVEIFALVNGVENEMKTASGDDVLEAWEKYTDLIVTYRALVDEDVVKALEEKVNSIAVRPIKDAVEVPNATVTIFDYNEKMPSDANKLVQHMHFVSPVSSKQVGNKYITPDVTDADVTGDYTDTKLFVNGGTLIAQADHDASEGYANYMPKLTRSENDDGYPNTAEGSMRPLFEKGATKDNNTMYTMKNGGGLFQMRDGYYYYDSQLNAAAYNASKNEFDLYNVVVQPKHRLVKEETDNKEVTTWGKIQTEEHGATFDLYWALQQSKGSFFPFNPLTGSNVEQFTAFETDIKRDFASYDANYYNRLYALKDPTNLSFGMMIEMEFFMPEGGQVDGKDIVFNFRGDDDVMVYIDNMPVMDLAGTWSSRSGNINFATGTSVDDPMSTDPSKIGPHSYSKNQGVRRTRTFDQIFVDANGDPDMTVLQTYVDKDGNTRYRLKENTTHTFKFFFMERGGDVSNCFIEFNMPTAPANALMIGKDVSVVDHTNGKALADELESTLEYKFRVLDESGKVMVNNTNYKILDAKTREEIRKERVREDGIITLHPGELALIENMPGFAGDSLDANYYVEELIPDTQDGLYKGVDVIFGGNPTGTVETQDQDITVGDSVEKFDGYKSVKMSTGNTSVVTFKNTVDVESFGKLQITKTVTDDSDSIFNKEFEFKVKLNDQTLSSDISYTLYDPMAGTAAGTKKYVSSDSTITLKKGQTAVIDGIMAGTTYEVKEVGASGYEAEYFVEETYTATKPVVDEVAGTMTLEEYTDTRLKSVKGAVEGVLGLEETVKIVVENESDVFTVPFSMFKTVEKVDVNKDYNFFFDVVQVDENKNEVEHPKFKLEEKVVEGAVNNVTVDEYEVTIPIEGQDWTMTPAGECHDCLAKIDLALKKAQAEADLAAAETGTERVTITEADLNLEKADTGHLKDCAKDDAPEAALATNKADLILEFDKKDFENEEGPVTLYFKVTERVPVKDSEDDHTDKFVYDDTEYLITIEIDLTKTGARAVVKEVKVDNEMHPQFTNGTIPELTFENKLHRNKPSDDDKTVYVTKVWSGIAEEDWEEIKVQLKDENGKLYDVKPLNKDNKWQTEWTGLDDDLAYYVVEIDAPEGMTVSYSGGGTSNQTITNSKGSSSTTPDPTTPPPGGGGGEESGDVLGIDDENVPLAEPEEEIPLLAGVADTGDNKIVIGAAAVMAAAFAAILALRKKKED